jgi:hypothetical protein
MAEVRKTGSLNDHAKADWVGGCDAEKIAIFTKRRLVAIRSSRIRSHPPVGRGLWRRNSSGGDGDPVGEHKIDNDRTPC